MRNADFLCSWVYPSMIPWTESPLPPNSTIISASSESSGSSRASRVLRPAFPRYGISDSDTGPAPDEKSCEKR